MSRKLVAVFIFFWATLFVSVTGAASVMAQETEANPDSNETGEVAESPSSTETDSLEMKVDRGDRVGVGNPVRVASDETVAGDVVGIGTRVEIDGVVRGDVVAVGARVKISGEVRGDLVGVGSNLEISPGARIRGEVVNIMGTLEDEGGQTNQVVNISPGVHLPALGNFPLGVLGFFTLWWKLLVLALVFVVLLLHSALVPDRVRIISDETPLRPVVAFLAGLLGYAALFVVSFFLAVTVVGLPLALLVYFAFKILQWLGFAGIFHYVGRRIGLLFGRDLSLLGAVLIGFLPFALIRFLPFCTGWFVWFLLEIVAIGFVILTRAGTRNVVPPGPSEMASVPTRDPMPPTAPTPSTGQSDSP